MPEVVSESNTISSIPTPLFSELTPVAMTAYVLIFMSKPSANHILFIVSSNCNVKMSWRRSSPDLNIMKTGGAPGSVFLKTSHSGAILELIKLQLSTINVETSQLGKRGTWNLAPTIREKNASLSSCNSALKVALLSFFRTFRARLAATCSATLCNFKIVLFCFLNSWAESSQLRMYVSNSTAKRSQKLGSTVSALRCQNKKCPITKGLAMALSSRNVASGESWYSSAFKHWVNCNRYWRRTSSSLISRKQSTAKDLTV
mmetsp:Transcript_17641/g.24782  ORF Transcript_17641/g.24782 Transcript_17641/m.24782 type:complete len:259 (-) Transcript_17641:1777-2553(-)